MGALHHAKWRLPAPDELKGTDAARRMDIFFLCLRLASISPDSSLQRTAEDKSRRTIFFSLPLTLNGNRMSSLPLKLA